MSREFKLVPVEPTREISDALAALFTKGFLDDNMVAGILKAIVDSAPQPPALGGEPDRDAFEDEYRKEFEGVRGYPISSEEMASMRDGEFYGPDRAFLNGQWAGWQKCHRASLAPYQAEIVRLKAQVAELVEAFSESQEMMIERGKRVAELEELLQMFIENSDDQDVIELSQNALRPTEGAQS